jgi:hypothetical protein
VLSFIFSWFFTYNFLSEQIPKQETQVKELGRRALIGFCASAISDTCSNSIRVVKVYKQSHSDVLSYPECVKRVIQESGLFGLFFRGLETKLLANGLQGEFSNLYTTTMFICFFVLYVSFSTLMTLTKNRNIIFYTVEAI